MLLFSFPAYAAYAASSSPSNLERLEETEEREELDNFSVEEETKNEYYNALLYRLDLVVSLLAMLFGCLCACIFAIFWRFR